MLLFNILCTTLNIDQLQVRTEFNTVSYLPHYGKCGRIICGHLDISLLVDCRLSKKNVITNEITSRFLVAQKPHAFAYKLRNNTYRKNRIQNPGRLRFQTIKNGGRLFWAGGYFEGALITILTVRCPVQTGQRVLE